jgi:putative colanic acid biosynthesis glycosyltransferase
MNNINLIRDFTEENPKISIIIPSYNQGNLIEDAILSVVTQSYKNVELIIIDGGSNDTTLNVIGKYASEISYWISEKDSGIYDAMNKGLEKATGDWIFFLGTDDKLNPNILYEVKGMLNEKYAVVYGAIIFDDGHIHRSFLSLRTILQNTLHHQSAFYNKDLFSDFRYDTNFKAISDYELNLKIFNYKYEHLYLRNTIIAECSSIGISSNPDISLRETNLVRDKYYGPFISIFLSQLLKLYYFQKKIRKHLKRDTTRTH